MLDWKSLHNTINSSARILLSTHENPDGDGLGSATAVYHYLTKIGKDCRLIIISDLPKEYQFLNLDNIIEEFWPENGPKIEKIKKYIKKYSKEKIVIKCGGKVLLDSILFDTFINDVSIIKKIGS